MAGICTQRQFVLTGVPGVGKTTLVKAILQELNQKGLQCFGFYTEEVRASGRRIGFDVITTSGQQGQLARVAEVSHLGARQKSFQVGQYSVNLASFEQTALPALQGNESQSEVSSCKIYIIDEVGKMEMFSQRFIRNVEKLMLEPSSVIIATIPVAKGKPIPLVEMIRSSPNSIIYEVTKQNRDSLLTKILPDVYSHMTSLNT